MFFMVFYQKLIVYLDEHDEAVPDPLDAHDVLLAHTDLHHLVNLRILRNDLGFGEERAQADVADPSFGQELVSAEGSGEKQLSDGPLSCFSIPPKGPKVYIPLGLCLVAYS